MERYVLLAEGRLGIHSSKTAVAFIRYRRDDVVAVIDSTKRGKKVEDVLGFGGDIPIVSSVEEAKGFNPTTLVVGISTIGGQYPEEWREIFKRAIKNGLNILNGLHAFLSDDPELSELARAHGVKLIDVRKVKEEYNVPARGIDPEAKVVLTVGTDANVGKMTVSYELHLLALKKGIKSAFAPTGQTGIMLEGYGVCIDRVISDFAAGATEKLVHEAAERGDMVFLEGQGSIIHPAFSGVTLSLLHGSRADALILVHDPKREHLRHYPDIKLPPLTQYIELYERLTRWVKPAKVVSIAINTYGLKEEDALNIKEKIEKETGLLTTDVIRWGGEELLEHVLKELKIKESTN